MSAFGWSFVIIGVLLSIGTLNPLPLLGAVLLGLVFDSGTSELQSTVRDGGLNPYTPENSCLGILLWIVGVGVFLLLMGMALVIAMEGW